MRYGFRRSAESRRARECGEGMPRCERIIADGDNPLRQCDEHRALFFARIGRELPPECPACVVGAVLDRARGAYVIIVGAMCFACGKATGGTVATVEHRGEARRKMRARLLAMFAAGERGAEWAATLARCPADIREAIERRIAKVTP